MTEAFRRNDCALAHLGGSIVFALIEVGWSGVISIPFPPARFEVDLRFEAKDEGRGRAPVGFVGRLVRRSARKSPVGVLLAKLSPDSDEEVDGA
jgi:hypothetical protein